MNRRIDPFFAAVASEHDRRRVVARRARLVRRLRREEPDSDAVRR